MIRNLRSYPWHLLGMVVLLLLWGGWQSQALHIFERDYDEGVYLAEAHLLHAGHDLYTEVKSPSPPFFLWGLQALFVLAGGPDVAAARLGVIALGGVGLLALAWIGARLAPVGRAWVGVVAAALLALFPRWTLYGQLAMADIPSLSLATLAVAVALQGWTGGRPWFFLGGVVAGAALWVKILAAYIAPVLALVVILSYRPVRPFHPLTFLGDGLATLGGFLLPILASLLFLDALAAYETLFLFPWDAGRQWVDPANALWLMAVFYWEHLGWTLWALAGMVALVWQRAWRVVALLLGWELLVVVMLSQHAPLWAHLLLPLAPPLMLAAALLWPLILQPLATAPFAPRARAAQLSLGGALLICLIFGALWPAALTADLATLSPPSRPTLLRTEVVPWLQSIVPATDRILTDDPMIAVRAGRLVPVEMSDTSFTKIGSGFLTADDLISAAQRDRPAAIIFWRDRFATLPEWRQWVEANYLIGRQYAPKRVIFVRPDLQPAKTTD